MPPKKRTQNSQEESHKDSSKLFNIAGKGLGYFTKSGEIVQVSDVSLKLAGRYYIFTSNNVLHSLASVPS